MTKHELRVHKMDLLCGMNEYIQHLNSREARKYWNYLAIDECDEDDLADIVDDADRWATVCSLFGKIVALYIEKGEDC